MGLQCDWMVYSVIDGSAAWMDGVKMNKPQTSLPILTSPINTIRSKYDTAMMTIFGAWFLFNLYVFNVRDTCTRVCPSL